MTIGRLILNCLAAPFGAFLILFYAVPYVLLLLAAIYFAPVLQLPESTSLAMADMAAGPVASVVGNEAPVVTASVIQTAITALILGFLTLLLVFQLHRLAGRIVDIGGYSMMSNYIVPARSWMATSGLMLIILGAVVAVVLSVDTEILAINELQQQITVVPQTLVAYLISGPVQGLFLITALFFGLTGVSGIKRAGYLEGIRTFSRGFSALLIMSFVFTVLIATAGFFFQTYVLPALGFTSVPRTWVLMGEVALLWATMSFVSAAWFKRMSVRVYNNTGSDMKRRLYQGYVG
ncbi:hypothetical protein [Parasulfitobacter algicola]|uniref:Uncharacterized protein n=1 Tax=Parasulfitobacter algicola TaxID=2614809 RepID=A0ABX2IWB1_9RHOB|nr:hypothetical protein [Sulfitobacter algicola]NSX54368.1 hypothetical protein [Sulfitobacter algicola]